jgi:2-hydroxy-3-keto-5-methylthiopentenyl-1-phosphate phosphatase
VKKAVQLDFDGTVTENDVSYLLLDKYAVGRWRPYLEKYAAGMMTVGAFSKKVFSMLKAGRRTMSGAILTSDRIKIRPGFREMMDYLSSHAYKVVIVSHGLVFYIEAILENLGLKNVEIHAAENIFSPGGMEIHYLGPDGGELDTGFKEAYTRHLMDSGYDVIYVGDGASDIYSARLVKYVFATGTLLERCREEKIDYWPFTDFYDVIRGLDALPKD